MHSQNVVIGSSADLVCAWLYDTFFCPHLPHLSASLMDFSAMGACAFFRFSFSSASSLARCSSDSNSFSVMATNLSAWMSPLSTRRPSCRLLLFLRLMKRLRILVR